MTHFFEMGGYADYVWPAYGITFVGLAGAVYFTLRSYGRAKALLLSIETGKRR